MHTRTPYTDIEIGVRPLWRNTTVVVRIEYAETKKKGGGGWLNMCAQVSQAMPAPTHGVEHPTIQLLPVPPAIHQKNMICSWAALLVRTKEKHKHVLGRVQSFVTSLDDQDQDFQSPDQERISRPQSTQSMNKR